MVRRHYVFYGRVQSVGFRFTMEQIATQLGLTGWVCNQYDGTVAACVQGEERLVLQLIHTLQNQRYIQIEKMDVEEQRVLENEKCFEIKF